MKKSKDFPKKSPKKNKRNINSEIKVHRTIGLPELGLSPDDLEFKKLCYIFY